MTEADLLPELDKADTRRFRGDRLIVAFLGVVVTGVAAGAIVLAELGTAVPAIAEQLATGALGGLLVMARAGSST